jgi:hypothetical protein
MYYTLIRSNKPGLTSSKSVTKNSKTAILAIPGSSSQYIQRLCIDYNSGEVFNNRIALISMPATRSQSKISAEEGKSCQCGG